MYFKNNSKNRSLSTFIIILIISLTKNVTGESYLQNYGTGIFKYKSTPDDDFYYRIMRINKDIPLFPNRFNEIRQYLNNDDEIDYDNKYMITKRVSKNIKTREDGGSYSHLHASRCYFNPVSC